MLRGQHHFVNMWIGMRLMEAHGKGLAHGGADHNDPWSITGDDAERFVNLAAEALAEASWLYGAFRSIDAWDISEREDQTDE